MKATGNIHQTLVFLDRWEVRDGVLMEQSNSDEEMRVFFVESHFFEIYMDFSSKIVKI